ncbi:MAG: hypothetical protein R3C44_16180 [Chloroflexota bacterium]
MFDHFSEKWLRAIERRRANIHLPSKFDRGEQRLVVQSIIIGVVVWLPVYLLKISVLSRLIMCWKLF